MSISMLVLPVTCTWGTRTTNSVVMHTNISCNLTVTNTNYITTSWLLVGLNFFFFFFWKAAANLIILGHKNQRNQSDWKVPFEYITTAVMLYAIVIAHFVSSNIHTQSISSFRPARLVPTTMQHSKSIKSHFIPILMFTLNVSRSSWPALRPKSNTSLYSRLKKSSMSEYRVLKNQ